MLDKLDNIFLKQKELDEFIIKNKSIDVGKYTKDEWIQKKAIALIEEVTEVLNETNYKWWKTTKVADIQLLKEELVDVLHFFVSMCITAELDSEQLFEMYMAKHQENTNRQLGKSSKQGYAN